MRLLHRLDARKREALRVTTDHARLRAARFLDGRERFWDKEEVLAVAPSATKTVVKPSTKATAASTIRRFAAASIPSERSSSKLRPASQAR